MKLLLVCRIRFVAAVPGGSKFEVSQMRHSADGGRILPRKCHTVNLLCQHTVTSHGKWMRLAIRHRGPVTGRTLNIARYNLGIPWQVVNTVPVAVTQRVRLPREAREKLRKLIDTGVCKAGFHLRQVCTRLRGPEQIMVLRVLWNDPCVPCGQRPREHPLCCENRADRAAPAIDNDFGCLIFYPSKKKGYHGHPPKPWE